MAHYENNFAYTSIDRNMAVNDRTSPVFACIRCIIRLCQQDYDVTRVWKRKLEADNSAYTHYSDNMSTLTRPTETFLATQVGFQK